MARTSLDAGEFVVKNSIFHTAPEVSSPRRTAKILTCAWNLFVSNKGFLLPFFLWKVGEQIQQMLLLGVRSCGRAQGGSPGV